MMLRAFIMKIIATSMRAATMAYRFTEFIADSGITEVAAGTISRPGSLVVVATTASLPERKSVRYKLGRTDISLSMIYSPDKSRACAQPLLSDSQPDSTSFFFLNHAPPPGLTPPPLGPVLEP